MFVVCLSKLVMTTFADEAIAFQPMLLIGFQENGIQNIVKVLHNSYFHLNGSSIQMDVKSFFKFCQTRQYFGLLKVFKVEWTFETAELISFVSLFPIFFF